MPTQQWKVIVLHGNVIQICIVCFTVQTVCYTIQSVYYDKQVPITIDFLVILKRTVFRYCVNILHSVYKSAIMKRISLVIVLTRGRRSNCYNRKTSVCQALIIHYTYCWQLWCMTIDADNTLVSGWKFEKVKHIIMYFFKIF